MQLFVSISDYFFRWFQNNFFIKGCHYFQDMDPYWYAKLLSGIIALIYIPTNEEWECFVPSLTLYITTILKKAKQPNNMCKNIP